MDLTLKLHGNSFEIARIEFVYSVSSTGNSPKITSYLLTE